MMPKPGLAWLAVFLLGGVGAFGVVRAQAPDRSLTLELLQRIEQLEQEVRHIRGELELYRHQVELLQKERSAPPPPSQSTTPVAPDVTSVVEQADETDPPVSVSSAIGEQASVPQPTPTASVESERMRFDTALREFGEGRYAQAISDFRQFLQSDSDSALANEAQYWLGEAYYAVQDYDAARESFINLGLRYPNSERLPEALLKLGYIYEMQGDISRARTVLQKLLQVYPETQAAGLAGQRLQLLR
ncbi:MAG: tol-pal system protein YbgF [Candidatus Competibacteraceae bacterium]|nr:tol-pal system protein YbgF [Candidatus Competibacteraceae bacterium]